MFNEKEIDPKPGEVWHLDFDKSNYSLDRWLILGCCLDNFFVYNLSRPFMFLNYKKHHFSHLAEDQSHYITLPKAKWFKFEVDKYYKLIGIDRIVKCSDDDFESCALLNNQNPEDGTGYIFPKIIEEVDYKPEPELKLVVGKVYETELKSRLLILRHDCDNGFQALLLQSNEDGFEQNGCNTGYCISYQANGKSLESTPLLVKESDNQSTAVIL
jgi:hypothetical protein